MFFPRVFLLKNAKTKQRQGTFNTLRVVTETSVKREKLIESMTKLSWFENSEYNRGPEGAIQRLTPGDEHRTKEN